MVFTSLNWLMARSLLIVTLLTWSMPALAAPIVDGFRDVGEYSNSFAAGWYNGHNADGSQYQKSGDHTTTVYWESTASSFHMYVEAPLVAKNMIWGTGFTDEEALLYYQHWCSPDDGNPAALDGSNCDHHKDGLAKFQSDKTDFKSMTGSEKLLFLGYTADLAGDASDELFAATLQEYQDSSDYVIANLGCDTTNCDASATPMAFEFRFDALSQNSIDQLISQIQTNELEFHLSPERGGSPMPEPSSTALFGLGLLAVNRQLRRNTRSGNPRATV